MKAPEWYKDWRHEAVHQLMAKQDRMKAEFRTNHWPRYDYDVMSETLIFSEDAKPKVRADIQIVGTTGSKDWLWGWANDHWPRPAVNDLLRVRDFGIENGIEELTTEHLEDEDLNSLGWEMTAVSARVLQSVGAYRPPSEAGALFLVYRSIGFVA